MKSVGFSHASTPLPNFTIVTPTSSSALRDDTAPPVGACSISARVADVSTHGVTRAEVAVVSADCSSVSVGILMPPFCGVVARITRLSSPRSVRARFAASASVIVGSSCCTSLYSYSMPGLGSSFRK